MFLKAHLKNPFLLPALIAGLGLTPLTYLMAQNYAAWPVTNVVAGGAHVLFTRSDGSLWGMGDNTYGQLGLGSTITNVDVPTEIISNGVVAIAAGGAHSLFRTGFTLWAMGYNNHGQLGDGTTINHYVPEPIAGTSHVRVTAIAAGSDFSLYGTLNSLTDSGGLWTMGDNEGGQLGDGSLNDHYTPEEIMATTGSAVKAVAGGFRESLFSKPDGSLWGMGDNDFGDLGLPQPSTYNSPTLIFSDPSVGTVVAIAPGSGFSLFVTSDGSLFGMGYNVDGELGGGAQFPYNVYATVEFIVSFYPGADVTLGGVVTAVAAGNAHSLFIMSNGSLWGMGDNSQGQLGVTTFSDNDNDGHYYALEPVQIVASNVVAVAAGVDNSFFIKSDGSLWGMGYNPNGQLGTGDYTNRYTPVEIVAPPPQLSIIPYGSNVILVWPANASAFTLQSTTNLAAPVWSTVSPGPVIIGNQCEVFIPASAPQQFYRLMLSQ